MKFLFPIYFLSISFVANAADNELSPEEKADGWQLLFDGKSMDQWVNYKKTTLNKKWSIQDGAMMKGHKAGDIVTKKSYKDFEFKCEWKIEKGGNSGIFVRVDPTARHIYSKAIEMQVLDPANRSGAKSAAGAIYDLIPAPKDLAKPAGEWNQVHIICKGPQMQFFFNGKKIGELNVGSEEWKKLIGESKFKNWQGFGMAPSGPIGLQEHGKVVWFKNLKIKELK